MTRTPRHGNSPNTSNNFTVYFDPSCSDTELFDSLAERQCDAFTNSRINSSQLRRFFGEIKDLYRRFDALTAAKPAEEQERVYRKTIEPLFKMVRSKVSYATRAGGQSKLDGNFAQMLSVGIAKVDGPEQFRRYVLHLEAVVGFMYGKGKVAR